MEEMFIRSTAGSCTNLKTMKTLLPYLLLIAVLFISGSGHHNRKEFNIKKAREFWHIAYMQGRFTRVLDDRYPGFRYSEQFRADSLMMENTIENLFK